MIESITSTFDSEAGAPVPASKAAEQKSQFLQLLVAQMKAQDPLNPMDGTEFVAQLAQFTSLEELINIRGVMEDLYETLGAQAGAANASAAADPQTGVFPVNANQGA